jgi:muramoyltetrapeptide carboxypeptidase
MKPVALQPGDTIAVVATASPAEPERLSAGLRELQRLGYEPRVLSAGQADGYFAGNAEARVQALCEALAAPEFDAVVVARGGFGTGYLLDGLDASLPARPRILLGHSDVTCLQAYLWQKAGWPTFYGPMAAAGFAKGADVPGGYDARSLALAVQQTDGGWSLDLKGEVQRGGEAEGVLSGGCLTLLRSTLGTPWELDARGAILVLEDLAMKPYQVDRALLHLKQAGKFEGVRGFVLGEFPECEAPAGGWNVRDVAHRILGELEVPLVWGAPVGHTPRPMLTLPLGVRCRLRAQGSGELEFLEPAVARP